MADLLASLLRRQRALGNAGQASRSCSWLTANSGAQALTRFLELALQIGIVQMGKVITSGTANMVSHTSPDLFDTPPDCGLERSYERGGTGILYGGVQIIVRRIVVIQQVLAATLSIRAGITRWH